MTVSIDLSKDEFVMLLNAMGETLEALDEFDFETRVGYTIEEFVRLRRRLRRYCHLEGLVEDGVTKTSKSRQINFGFNVGTKKDSCQFWLEIDGKEVEGSTRTLSGMGLTDRLCKGLVIEGITDIQSFQQLRSNLISTMNQVDWEELRDKGHVVFRQDELKIDFFCDRSIIPSQDDEARTELELVFDSFFFAYEDSKLFDN